MPDLIELQDKEQTYVPGLDIICNGGLPKRRMTLITGTAGSGKTILCAQYVVEGALHDLPGVFVSFEESTEDLKRNLNGFGWPIEELEQAGKLSFVDASMKREDDALVTGDFDLLALSARISHAVARTKAVRVSIDSVAAVFLQFQDSTLVRRELLRLSWEIRKLGVTALLTAERRDDYGEISRFGVEEYVADNVVILRNQLEDERRRRTIELLKIRGTDHRRGEVSFTISNRGIVVLPVENLPLTQPSSERRVTSGIAGLDEMTGGGLFRDSVVLISGATGSGKTCLATHFAAGSSPENKTLFCGFEESRDQLRRNARGWGISFDQLSDEDCLLVIASYPESKSLEDHLLTIIEEIDSWRPTRIVIDSLSALERIAPPRQFRDFLLHLTAFMKEREITGLITDTAPHLFGGTVLTRNNISTLCDTVVMLRYLEVSSRIRRGLTVLKMRGSDHEKSIREFHISERGFELGEEFGDVGGILATSE